MDVNEIRKLVRLMEEAGLTELEIEDRSGKVRLVRGAASRAQRRGSPLDPEEDLPSLAGATTADGDVPPVVAGSPLGMLSAASTVVSSPMVGTFYRASAPDAEPFVSAGDVVQVGQVLCIIEAMKMMNEIHAESAGRIVSVEAENGSPVEYGSPLFVIAALD